MKNNQGYIYVPYIISDKIETIYDSGYTYWSNKTIKSRYSVANINSNFYGIFNEKQMKRDERRKKLNRIFKNAEGTDSGVFNFFSLLSTFF